MTPYQMTLESIAKNLYAAWLHEEPHSVLARRPWEELKAEERAHWLRFAGKAKSASLTPFELDVALLPPRRFAGMKAVHRTFCAGETKASVDALIEELRDWLYEHLPREERRG